MHCTLRIPDVLHARIVAECGERGRTAWILEACRMRLDSDRGDLLRNPEAHGFVPYASASKITPELVERVHGTMKQQFERAVDEIPNMQALRDICAGKVQSIGSATTDPNSGGPVDRGVSQTAGRIEIPICGKTWWEDGEQYECLMDKGHREALANKHGLRGMVRRLDG